jgi:hypothetical protein
MVPALQRGLEVPGGQGNTDHVHFKDPGLGRSDEL